LDRPREIEVRVGSEFRQVHPVRLYRLWGRVTSFTGDPIAEPIINASCGAGAVGDADGYYSIVLDGPTQHVAVFDKGYSFSTLETWLYDLDLGADTPLDIRIGSLEVYELGGWLAYGGAYLHFIPMSLHRILPLVQQGLTEQDLVARPEIWPHLSAKDVKVFIEGQEVPIATFSEYQDFLGEREGTKLTRPGYIVGITREHWRPGAVRVEVSHGCEYEGKQIMERGEGYFLGFR